MRAAAGVYVHLPYCRSRCGYCAFVVTTEESSRRAYLEALAREIEIVAREARGESLDSIYIGGGTPSLIPAASLASLRRALTRAFAIEPDSEVTLEANPDDVTPSLAEAWKQAGVTRVSLGVQSFDDRELQAVGRRHDAAAAAGALESLVARGFSVSGDLILGLPEQTAESFRASVARLAEAGASHVSVYLLETEKSKALEEDRRLHPQRYLSDDAQADVWLEMGETLAVRGFRHYEISNWAEPGREARHNLKYWTRTPTLGLGVSAHELWQEHRRANVSSLERYIAELEAGRRPLALDRAIDEAEAAREEIYLGLRLSVGVPADSIEALVAASQDAHLADDYDGWIGEGILKRTDGRVRFTERGFLLSNEVLSRFV